MAASWRALHDIHDMPDVLCMLLIQPNPPILPGSGCWTDRSLYIYNSKLTCPFECMDRSLTTSRVIIIIFRIPRSIRMRMRSLQPSWCSGACMWWRSTFGHHSGPNMAKHPQMAKWAPKMPRETNKSFGICGWWLAWGLPYSLEVLVYGTWIIIIVRPFDVGDTILACPGVYCWKAMAGGKQYMKPSRT